MILRRGFRYRIYPTLEQAQRLVAWEHALRALWNFALEQRQLVRARGRHARVPTVIDQCRELTALRAVFPFFADLPRSVSTQTLIDLDLAWQRARQGLARTPQFKKRGRDPISFTECDVRGFRLTLGGLAFPKLGIVPVRYHRPLRGKAKRWTIRREVDQWFVSILCEIEVPDPVLREQPVVAIDRGLTNVIADSNGVRVSNPRHLDRALRRLAHAQRVVARRTKGSHRRERARRRVAVLHRKIRRQRAYLLHVLSYRYAKSHGSVVVEDLNIRGMVRGGLGRHIHGAGWGLFCTMLRYKLEERGGRLERAPAQYSSQTCAACGIVDAHSRRGEHFSCTACGHHVHADVNAAQVLLLRRIAGDTGRRGHGYEDRPMKRQLRVVRRGTGHGSGSLQKPRTGVRG
jgi:putative transposase